MGTRQIGMGQRLALVAVEQHAVTSLGLGVAQLKAQAHALDLGSDLPSLQRVPGPPPPGAVRTTVARPYNEGLISIVSRMA